MSFRAEPLGDLIGILSGFAFKSKHFNTEGRGLPLIRIRDVLRGTTETFYDGRFDKEYIVQPGDILIGMDGEFNCAKWRGGRSLLNQRVCRITATNAKVDQEFIYRFLPLALKVIEERTPFVTVKHLSVKDIRAIKIPVPPMKDQKRITEVLQQADTVREDLNSALATLDELYGALLDRAFGENSAISK
jgi:type I restriction enzyme S subunit